MASKTPRVPVTPAINPWFAVKGPVVSLLKTPLVQAALVSAAKKGEVPLTAISTLLYTVIGNPLKDNRVKPRVGVEVRKVLVQFGFKVSKVKAIKGDAVFANGSCYI
jgi:hypothetical protein